MSDTRMRLDPSADASTGVLVQQMAEQVSTLVRDELALARTEMVEKGKRAGAGAGMLGGAGVLALYGVSTLLLTIGAALALAWPAWLAALTVMVVVFAAAGVAALVGKKQVEQAVPPAPTAAAASAKRDVDTVATAVREGRRG
ncbi:phage holin family protein [Couchioplanes azureus]|uniref:phage holin family protein n=1 Tax=Couchioplanes caeruleus TaxID=56438 RepID=UPI001E51F65E|nr:phage holin family protein [Couchioplanes caeruleus]